MSLFQRTPNGLLGRRFLEKHGALNDSMPASVVSKPSIEAHDLIEVRGKKKDTDLLEV